MISLEMDCWSLMVVRMPCTNNAEFSHFMPAYLRHYQRDYLQTFHQLSTFLEMLIYIKLTDEAGKKSAILSHSAPFT
jgi:hypothetical protein